MSSDRTFFSKSEFAAHVAGAFNRVLAKNAAIPSHLPQICPSWLAKVRRPPSHDAVKIALARAFETRPTQCVTGVVFDIPEIPSRAAFFKIFDRHHCGAKSPEDEYSTFRASICFALAGSRMSCENTPERRTDGTFGRRKDAWAVLPIPFGGAAFMIRTGGEKVFVTPRKFRIRNLALAFGDESLSLDLNPVGLADMLQAHPLSEYLNSPSDEALATLLRNISTQPVAFPRGASAFRPPSLARAVALRETRVPLNLSGPWSDDEVGEAFASADTTTVTWLAGLSGISAEARGALQLSTSK